jgi:division protein CdvB (Snf7/Vps24/ESCRT-III family)
MNRLINTALSFSIIFAANSAFACDYPNRVLIPNGNSATKEEMIEGQRGVKTYVADMEIYLECIVEEDKEARNSVDGITPEDEQERDDLVNKRYNAAVDEMERVAAQFNAEVQAYRAQQGN